MADRASPLRRLARRIVPIRARDAIVHRALFSDAQSRRRFRRAYSASAAEPVALRLRALDGGTVTIRAGTTDPWILRELVTYGDHWPPPEIGVPRVVLDLGANIGLSMALLAHRYPAARIVGVEPSPENVALCRENIAQWGERCEVVAAAAWPEDGEVRLEGDDPSAFFVGTSGAGTLVAARSVSGLVDEYAIDGWCDYVKVDIEGAEVDLLARGTEWAEHVRCISVEVHAPYTVERCRSDLIALGYEVTTKAAPREPRVVGIRPPT
jgi:FkbM family methyltransferase